MTKNLFSFFGIFFLICFAFVNCVGYFFTDAALLGVMSAMVAMTMALVYYRHTNKSNENFLYILVFAAAAFFPHLWNSKPTILWTIISIIWILFFSQFSSTYSAKNFPNTKKSIRFFGALIFQLLIIETVYIAASIPWWGNLICVAVPATICLFAGAKRTTQTADRVLEL
ncbi:MAG: hypothetical protein Athens101428_414 [Candidatus Berkelbacteria bacterium Athens1014_28]|uniref:Uncharacterized protein n=1 Tax=Candidatus Berkelbacteria bacterium Athens1014_28 TaxID=2017145 RepID=A0A554LML9_9BACT|nr:MAG: hypothetical protein Athens101428_414 [Candidatus Berkelbacteria bacterium Athens1014_28]